MTRFMPQVAPLLAALSAAFLLACNQTPAHADSEAPKPTAAEESPRIVTIPVELLTEGRVMLAKASKRDITDDLVVTGQVIAPPLGKAEIGALLTARIRKIFVEEGEIVKKGQVLATLVAPDAARISGELAAARARRARAETVLTQETRLAEQKATSDRAVSDAVSDAASARADEQAAVVMLSSYNVSGAELTLRSPLDGVVASSHALLGAQVESSSILFRIIDPSKLAVRADVPESMAERIPLGTQTEFQLPGRSKPCKAEVAASTRSVDPIKRTVGFRLRPLGTCEGLLEGGFADVTIPLQPMVSERPTAAPSGSTGSPAVSPEASANTSPNAPAKEPPCVTIPRSAIVELDGVPTAFVAQGEPGHFRLTPLRVRRHTETQSLIEQGLTGDEQVVSRGALLLKGEWMKSRLE